MRVVVTTPPADAVSLADAKAHLKVKHVAEDALIAGLVAAATQSIDGPNGWLGRAIGVQTLEASFSVYEASASALRLPYPPAIDLVAVSWLHSNGTVIDGDLADFELIGDTLHADGTPPWSGMKIDREALRIRYRAGYQATPAPIRAAILLMVGDLYRNRETVTAVQMSEVPMSATVKTLLGPFRVFA